MAVAGISTLGVKLFYGKESTAAGTKPGTFKQLTRINEIGGIDLSTESIDVSALEDLVQRNVAGRQSTGGTWSVTVNVTDDTIKEWNDLIDEYTALTGGKRMWFEVYNEALSKAFFVVAQPPRAIPVPSTSQNEAWTMEIQLVIEEYIGLDTAVVPSTSAGA